MAMDDTTAFRDWLTGLGHGASIVKINDDSSPDSVDFQIKHKKTGAPTRKELMAELMKYKLWLVSATPVGNGDNEIKRYKVVGGAGATRPTPLDAPTEPME